MENETSIDFLAPRTARIYKRGFLILLLLCLAGLLISLGRHKASTSLGPALDLPAPSPGEARLEGSSIFSGLGKAVDTLSQWLPGVLASGSSSPSGAVQLDSQAKPNAKPVCGGPPNMLVLAAGADADDYLYGLSDVIRIARLDFVEPSITILSLPRDLWVEIPGIQDRYGYTHGKLNQAYFFGCPGMGYYDGPAGGPGLLALTLYHNYGLAVDHYFATNSGAAVQFVDALGGIDLLLPEDVDGGTLQGGEGLGYFKAGGHHFDGQTALRFARIRMKYSDFKRQDNQSLVLMAVRDRLLSPAVLPRLPALVETFRKSVLTDLSMEQFGQAACLLGKVGKENILLTQLPSETYTVTRTYSDILKGSTSIVAADPQLVSDYLGSFAAGNWPQVERTDR
jgi:LCP family protein required for cell wall assembly